MTLSSSAIAVAASSVEDFDDDIRGSDHEQGTSHQQQVFQPLLLDEEHGTRPAMTLSFLDFRMLEVPGSTILVEDISRHYRWKRLSIFLPYMIVVSLFMNTGFDRATTTDPYAKKSNIVWNTLMMIVPFLPVLIPSLYLTITLFYDRQYFYKYGVVEYAFYVQNRRKGCCVDVGIGTHTHVMMDLTLGYYFEIRGDYTDAISCYTRFINDQHPYLQTQLGGICVYKRLGNSYYALGRYEQALENYQRAIQIRRLKSNPTTGSGGTKSKIVSRPSQYQHDYHCLGQTYKALKKYDDALESYQKAIDLLQERYSQTLDIAKTYLRIGGVYEDMGGSLNVKKAVTAYEHALEIYLMNAGEKYPKSIQVAKLYDQLGNLYSTRINNQQTDIQSQGNQMSTTNAASSSISQKKKGDGGDDDKKDDDDDDNDKTTNHDFTLQYWDSAIKVYEKLGKTNQDQEICNIQSKISSLSSSSSSPTF